MEAQVRSSHCGAEACRGVRRCAGCASANGAGLFPLPREDERACSGDSSAWAEAQQYVEICELERMGCKDSHSA